MTIADTVKNAALAPFAGRTLIVGLLIGDRLSDEIMDEGYERQPVQFSEPQGEDGVRFVENVDEPLFELGTATAYHLVRFVVFDGMGEFMGDWPLLESRDLPAGDRAFFRASTLRIGIP